jgi:malonate transporter
MVPLVNVLSVVALARHVSGGGLGLVLTALLRNPLVLGCAAGIALNLSRLGLPPIAAGVLDILGDAALGLGLLVVGGGLAVDRIRASLPMIAAASAIKLLVLPLATALACRAFGVEGLPAQIAVLYAALPGSPAGYVLARQMGGDATLMAAIVCVTTVLGLATIPLVLAWLT